MLLGDRHAWKYAQGKRLILSVIDQSQQAF